MAAPRAALSHAFPPYRSLNYLGVHNNSVPYWCSRGLYFKNGFSSNSESRELKGVVGLEIHAQINSFSKLFSGASTAYGAAPNTQVALFDAAHPGTLPVLNKYCVEAAVRTAIALGATINKVSRFDRKHYFYADMPAGYQITQQATPIAVNGAVDYVIYTRGRHKEATRKRAHLHQIQLEQDSGKSLHDEKHRRSLVDLNRAGVPLMEIVTKPDFETGEQAAAFVREIQAILKHISTCDGKMEEGSLRVDANVSVHCPGEPLGVRTEIKNLNSIKSVQEAIEYEIERQKKAIKHGEVISNETMSFDSMKRITQPMRDKERLQDYRFMAEPNLPPLVLSDVHSSSAHIVSIEVQRSRLPELRQCIRERLLRHGLRLEHVATLMELHLVEAFDKLTPLTLPDTPAAAIFSFLYQVVMMFCGERKNMTTEDFMIAVNSSELYALWRAIDESRLTVETAKRILHESFEDRTKQISNIIELDHHQRINDCAQIRSMCASVMMDNAKLVRQYKRRGQTIHFNLLLKELRARSDYRIDMADAVRFLNEALSPIAVD